MSRLLRRGHRQQTDSENDNDERDVDQHQAARSAGEPRERGRVQIERLGRSPHFESALGASLAQEVPAQVVAASNAMELDETLGRSVS